MSSFVEQMLARSSRLKTQSTLASSRALRSVSECLPQESAASGSIAASDSVPQIHTDAAAACISLSNPPVPQAEIEHRVLHGAHRIAESMQTRTFSNASAPSSLRPRRRSASGRARRDLETSGIRPTFSKSDELVEVKIQYQRQRDRNGMGDLARMPRRPRRGITCSARSTEAHRTRREGGNVEERDQANLAPHVAPRLSKDEPLVEYVCRRNPDHISKHCGQCGNVISIEPDATRPMDRRRCSAREDEEQKAGE